MPVLDISYSWMIILNFLGWLFIHISVSYFCFKIPISFFGKDFWWSRIRRPEYGGKLYKKMFKINKWKHYMPDGGGLFRNGFPKKNLANSDPKYLKTFLFETKRGELLHWLIILPVPVFFVWNLWWVGLIMIAYAIIVNIPCILVQRYNRARLSNLFEKKYEAFS